MLSKRLSLVALLAATSQLALASPGTGTLQFSGAVKGTTCTVSVGGVEAPTPATVVLRDALLERFPHPPHTDGRTAFDIDLKDCSGPGAQVRTGFRRASGNTGHMGNLDNMATDNPARNIQLAIGSRAGGYPIWVGDGQHLSPAADIEGGMARLELWVEYQATYFNDVTPGRVEAAAEFSLSYQ